MCNLGAFIMSWISNRVNHLSCHLTTLFLQWIIRSSYRWTARHNPYPLLSMGCHMICSIYKVIAIVWAEATCITVSLHILMTLMLSGSCTVEFGKENEALCVRPACFSFSLYVLQECVKELLQHYQWELAPEQDLTYKTLPISRPRNDVLATFSPRTSSHLEPTAPSPQSSWFCLPLSLREHFLKSLFLIKLHKNAGALHYMNFLCLVCTLRDQS